jgi:hypothetical protein
VGTWQLAAEDQSWKRSGRGSEWVQEGTRASHEIRVTEFMTLLEKYGAQIAESACARILSEPKYEDERYVITLI